ncbi:MAG: helix-turn-helix domain-containing protein [Desulfobaccales bacterium]
MAATPFKLERVKRELTQVELAALSGIPQHRIRLLERGVRPRADEVEALADAFKVNPEKLFQGA